MRMGDQLLVNGRHRLEVERERKQQEDKVREITQQLQELHRNKVDQQRRLREEEVEEAERFESDARQL